MANRRMFSMKIVDTDAFLEMPQSSQLLYFHLAMRADDDGFISNPRRIMKMIGSNDDDFKVLLLKRFLLNFESGVCVIKHWLIHNLVRGDRYTPTQYIREKQMLIIDDKTKKYSLNNGSQLVIPNDNQRMTQDRLGEDSIDKIKEEKDIYGEFENVKLKKEEHQKLVENIGENNTKVIIEELSSYMASKGKRYSSHYATLLNWARRKYQESQRSQNNKRKIV